MADDKGAGGGGGWDLGAIEIIVGILLLIGILDHLLGNGGILTNSNKAIPTYGDTQATTPQSNLDQQCGLTVTKPEANQKQGMYVSLSGTTGICEWRSTLKVALYAQIVDSKGKSVSGYIPVPPTSINQDEATFDSTIALTAKPAAGTGYLILVPAVPPETNQSVSARIPLKF